MDEPQESYASCGKRAFLRELLSFQHYQHRRKASPNRTQGHKGGDIRRECASIPDYIGYILSVSCRPTVGHTEC